MRGFQAADFRYTLTVRAQQPDFTVTLDGANPNVGAGSAREFKVAARRIDGFEGPIRIDIAGVPAGFRVTTPLLIESGQLDAIGVIEAEPGAAAPAPTAAAATTVTATARVGDRDVTHTVNNLGKIGLAPLPNSA